MFFRSCGFLFFYSRLNISSYYDHSLQSFESVLGGFIDTSCFQLRFHRRAFFSFFSEFKAVIFNHLIGDRLLSAATDELIKSYSEERSSEGNNYYLN